MTPSLWIGLVSVLALPLLASACVAGRSGSDTPRSNTDDAAEIEAHVRGLFEAYLRRDREAIRRGHTHDWIGFPITATEIVRGIDAYMEHADRSLERFRGVGYEIREMQVDVSGDVGIVTYVAAWRFRGEDGGEETLPLRSVDVYRREEGGWNQAGSNISVVPEPAPPSTR